jgi:hypothetical protein
MKISKIATIPDLFGNIKTIYETDEYEGNIISTKEKEIFVQVYDKKTNTLVEGGEVKEYSYNFAYLKLYEIIWRLTNQL